MSSEFSRKMKEISTRWELLKAEHQETESPVFLSLYGMQKSLFVEQEQHQREHFKLLSPATL